MCTKRLDPRYLCLRTFFRRPSGQRPEGAIMSKRQFLTAAALGSALMLATSAFAQAHGGAGGHASGGHASGGHASGGHVAGGPTGGGGHAAAFSGGGDSRGGATH